MGRSVVVGFLVALSLAATTVDAGAQCLLQGTTATRTVTVTPPDGDQAFTVEVSSPVVTIDPRPGHADEVAGSLVFRGDVELRSVRLSVRAPTVIRGVVYLGGGAELQPLRARGGTVRVRAHIDRDLEVTLSIPCRRLRVGWSRSDAPSEGETLPPSRRGVAWELRRASVGLRRSPGGPVVATARGRTHYVSLARRGEWIRVTAGGPYAYVFGWARASEFRRIGRSYGFGFMGRPARVPPIRSGPPDIPNAPYQAWARVPEGTPVSAAPGAAPWATTGAVPAYIARAEPGNDWAQLVGIPGISDADGGAFDHAWVPRASVSFEVQNPFSQQHSGHAPGSRDAPPEFEASEPVAKTDAGSPIPAGAQFATHAPVDHRELAVELSAFDQAPPELHYTLLDPRGRVVWRCEPDPIGKVGMVVEDARCASTSSWYRGPRAYLLRVRYRPGEDRARQRLQAAQTRGVSGRLRFPKAGWKRGHMLPSGLVRCRA